jgi:hypothetical protein
MKRLFVLLVLVSAGLLLYVPRVSAQEEEEAPPPPPAGLTMQMGNGWNFTFAGNVNAFYIYTDGNDDDDAPLAPVVGGLVAEEQVSSVRTGLLPAFAVFEAKGHEKDLDLGVHFGFAPQIQNGGNHDFFGSNAAGAQIDMRQVYAFFGGPWGQILFGREIGLYNRQNILNDQTLFGVGSTGGGGDDRGTTLGRIGFGYIYPNFVAQMTYSTPAGKPAQLSIGIFDPNFINSDADFDGDGFSDAYTTTKTPRFEGEFTWNSKSSNPDNNFLFWVNGLIQTAQAPSNTDLEEVVENDDVTAIGGGAGLRLNFGGFSLVGSGYYGEGIGSTLLLTTTLGVDGAGNERTSYGYIGQATYTTPGGWTFGGSWGDSRVNQTDFDEAVGFDALLKSNRSIIGTIVYQATSSLKVVGEFTHTESESHAGVDNTSDQGALGFMLFY